MARQWQGNNRAIQQDDDRRTAQQLLQDQLLILSLIHNKLEIVKHIQTEQGHATVAQNPFITDVAHVYYRSLVIDFTALFGRDGTNDSNSLQQLYNKKYDKDLSEDQLREIRSKLGSYKPDKNPIKRLTNYRNKEIAHYDPTASNDGLHRITAKFNWEFVDIMTELYTVAEKVISIGLDKPIEAFTDSVTNKSALEKILNDLSK